MSLRKVRVGRALSIGTTIHDGASTFHCSSKRLLCNPAGAPGLASCLGSPALAVAIARLVGPQPSLCLCARSQTVSQNKLPREACLSHAKGVPAQAQHRQCRLRLQILLMLPLHQLPQLQQPICLSQMISMFGPIVRVCGKSSQTSLHKMSPMQARFGRALFVVSAPHDSASRCHCSSLLAFWLQFFGQSCASSSHGLCC